MSIPLLLEHDTFPKTRRALMISSVSLIILSQLTFQTNTIEIFKLKLGVSPEKIITWGMIAVTYFIYLSFIEIRPYWLNFNAMKHKSISDEVEPALNDLWEKLEERANPLSPHDGFISEKNEDYRDSIDKQVERIFSRSLKFNGWYIFLKDVVPIIGFSLVSLYMAYKAL